MFQTNRQPNPGESITTLADIIISYVCLQIQIKVIVLTCALIVMSRNKNTTAAILHSAAKQPWHCVRA